MCFHKYEIISEGKGVMTFNSLLYGTLFRERVSTSVYKCKRCGKTKAYATRIDNTKIKINPDLI